MSDLFLLSEAQMRRTSRTGGSAQAASAASNYWLKPARSSD
jgi:hypothetical protein